MARERGVASAGPRNIEIGAYDLASAPLRDIRTGFRSGFAIEVRDTRNQRQPVAVHSFALNPSTYILSEPFQSTLTPTEDNFVVAEENGQIIREITLSGTFGITEKRGPTFNGDQGSRSGNEHFIHLRNLFRDYGKLKQDPKVASFVQMIFHSMRDDDHFVVVPRSFETPRDAKTTRLHYEYRVTLAVISDATVPTNLLAIPKRLDTLSKAFHDARASFAEATSKLGDIKARVQNVERVLVQAAELINSVGEVLDGTAGLINYPLEGAANVATDLANAADRLANSSTSLTPGSVEETGSRQLRRLESALDRILAIPEKFGPSSIQDTLERYEGEQGLTAGDLNNGLAGADIGSRTRLALGSGGDADTIDILEYTGLARERVDRTTTIQGLANQFQAPPELIILANNLSFPYIAEGGGPGVLKPGDVILIPVREGATGDTGQPSNSYLTAEELLYGIDMALDTTVLKDNEFDLQIAQSLTDVDLKRGLDNVIQGTEITVRTERGSTVYVPEVGVRRSVGVKGTIQHMLLTALNLREGILADPRVEGIEDTKITLESDVLSQEITPRLRGNQTGVNLVLPFGTATGEF